MTAKGNARVLLDNYFVTGPDKLDLTAIAGHQNIVIEEADLKNHIARIHHTEDCGLIKISNKIPDEGQKRFVIAHELGHFINERKKNIHGCTSADLIEYKSKKELEREANVFAAELLMREEWVKDFTKGRIPGIQLIKDCAEHFRTSLTSAAIRYAEAGRHPSAVILSKDKKVVWSAINKEFKFQWVPAGYDINGNSYVYEYFKDGTMDTDINEALADAWFSEDKFYRRNYKLFEQNIYLTNYNSVLSVLWEK
ncbi:MAG: ImmA/IrrE family metallo-endopeptidase [Ignavibacteriaceae bacterium]